MIGIRAAAESHTGYVRANNEDLAVVSGDLVAIADGMGGHLGGEVAARTAIEELVEAFQRDRTAAGLSAAVQKANRAIWRRSRVDRQVHGMGTTLTAIACVPASPDDAEQHLTLVNVGDSRAYLLEPDGAPSPRLHRLTEDHSVAEEMVRQGELTPDQAAVHPHRHVLTRVLGMDPEVELDIWDLDPEPGSRLLLCSDGLTDLVPEPEIESVLGSEEDPHDAARELVGHALAHGGVDNVTVVVVDVVEDASSLGDQPVEMVPPRPQLPDLGDRDVEDLTQALPVMRSEPPAGDEPAGPDSALNGGPPTIASPAATPFGDETVPLDTGARTDEPPAVRGSSARRTGRSMTVAGGAFAAGAGAAAAGADGAAALDGGAAAVGGVDGGMGGVSYGPGAAGVAGGAAAYQPSGPASRTTVLVPTRRVPKQYRDRILTVRVFLFVVVLAALLGGVIGVVIWFQRSSYYVGLRGTRVAIYEGRPGGLLWFKPQLIWTSSLTTKELLPNSVSDLNHGIAASSYGDAKQEVSSLQRLSRSLGLSGTAVNTSTTTGTLPFFGATTSVATAGNSPPPLTTSQAATTSVPSTTTAVTTTAPTTTVPPTTSTPTTTAATTLPPST